jgi:hypothetical protein
MQVIDITLVKYYFTNITSLRVVQQKHSGLYQALNITSHNVTKDSSSSSIQRGTLEGSNLILQSLVANESSKLNMMPYSSRFILSVRCD